MKAIQWTVNEAFIIVIFGFIVFTAWFGWRAMKSPDSFAVGPGRLDFSAHLAGDYSLHRTSAIHVSITPGSYNDGTPIIPTMVVECATDGRFILAKRHGLKQRASDGYEVEDPSTADFWILDTWKPLVHGPMTEKVFLEHRAVLSISSSVKLKNVYEFRQWPPSASSDPDDLSQPDPFQTSTAKDLE